MADFVLKSNYYEFSGQTKQLISGTAIGNKFGSPYACFFMDKIETAFLETKEFQSLVWFRYIDDIFFTWTHGGQNFELFCAVSISSILTWNLYMSQAKKGWHFLTFKLVLKAVRLLQICIENLPIAINISITCLLIKTTPNDL